VTGADLAFVKGDGDRRTMAIAEHKPMGLYIPAGSRGSRGRASAGMKIFCPFSYKIGAKSLGSKR